MVLGGDVALRSGNSGRGKEPGDDHGELHFDGGELLVEKVLSLEVVEGKYESVNE